MGLNGSVSTEEYVREEQDANVIMTLHCIDTKALGYADERDYGDNHAA